MVDRRSYSTRHGPADTTAGRAATAKRGSSATARPLTPRPWTGRPTVPQPFSSARMLVKVFDGGSMPTAAERVYFTHPVLLTGSEAEGGTGTLTVDTATTVPVIVLGDVPSVAGDYLTAYAVGGRWVAERGGSGGGGARSAGRARSRTRTSRSSGPTS